jgi:hypothetical protein
MRLSPSLKGSTPILFFQLLSGFLSHPLLAAEDQFESSVIAGASGFAQHLQINNHFFIGTTEQDARNRVSTILKQSPFSYHLGVLLNQVSAQSYSRVARENDLSYFGTMGLDWDALPELKIGLKIQGGLLPSQGYRTIGQRLKVEYNMPLLPKLQEEDDEGPLPEIDANDARAFYRRLKEEQIREGRRLHRQKMKKLAESVQTIAYPALNFAFSLGQSQHIAQQLYQQYELGPDLMFYPSSRFQIGLGARFYIYDPNIDLLSASVGSSNTLTRPLLYDQGLIQMAFPVLFFPNFSANQTMTWKFSEIETLTVNFDQVVVGAVIQRTFFSFNPTYDREFGRNWKAGLGAYLITGSPDRAGNSLFWSGSLRLGYKL